MQARFSREKQGQLWWQRERLQLTTALVLSRLRNTLKDPLKNDEHRTFTRQVSMLIETCTWYYVDVLIAAIKSGIRFAALGEPSPVTAFQPGTAE